ncbi:MAG: hypothetical protein IRZ33_10960 [Alicyclobacillaceae bacterium]|nr:hypothetical protein [Alicyclobacillaceae bacterium]
MSARDDLEMWSRLESRRRRLEASIAEREAYLRRLRESLSVFPYQSPVIDGLPRGSDVGDPVGGLIAKTLERIERVEWEIEGLRQELGQVRVQLTDIEAAVRELRPEYQQVVTLYYRDRASWQAIEAQTHYSKSRIYEILDAAVEALDGLLWAQLNQPDWNRTEAAPR